MSAPVVLFERSGVLAIAKPPGLATQAAPGIPSVESWLRDRLHAGSPLGYVGVPHRLDRAVSGILLMASTPRAARQLSRQFERRQVAKTYLALVSSRGDRPREFDRLASAGSAGLTWEDMLVKIPDEARAELAAATTPGARSAVTHAVLCGEVRDTPAAPESPGEPGQSVLWLLRLEPVTGRMHQLRVQAAARGLPILGDALYGGPGRWRPLVLPTDREGPIALHAWRIAYRDPDSGEAITAEAALPAWWPAAVRDLADNDESAA
jgi:23S rRNA pseudouridine1911/1915/1917 synthase